jgi:zeaxanthin glucosyltransferase
MPSKRIVLILLAAGHSHYNLTYKLAKNIRDKGFLVVFVGPAQFEANVILNGFEFSSVPCRYIYFNFEEPQLNLRILRDQVRNIKLLKLEVKELQNKINFFKPELLLLDAFLSRLYPHFSNTNCIIIQTMLSLHKSKYVPPINTSYIPKISKISAVACSILWISYFIKKKVLQQLINLGTLGMNFHHTINKNGHSDQALFGLNKTFHPSIKGVMEIMLSPKELDFPFQSKNINQIYLGLSVDLHRHHKKCNLTEEFLKTEVIKKRKIIYCAFGSISNASSTNRFIYKLISVAKRNSDKFALLIGSSHTFNPAQVVENCTILPFPDQLSILSRAFKTWFSPLTFSIKFYIEFFIWK